MRRRDFVETPIGRCAVVELAEDVPLVGEEETIAAALSARRRREFIAGRAAIRALLGQDVAILRNDRGAPVLPDGWVGSISHKEVHAAAIAAPAHAGYVGIDLEDAAPPRQPIERRILTARELTQISDGRDITLRFSIKEAIYKAIDPIVRRYVGFTEVELEVASDGTCAVHIVDAAQLPVAVEAWWTEHDGFWLTTARARRR
jgi:enterobactin synthetase component D